MKTKRQIEIRPREGGGFIVETYNNGLYVGGPVDSLAEAAEFIRRHGGGSFQQTLTEVIG
jgi:hypothetical protein